MISRIVGVGKLDFLPIPECGIVPAMAIYNKPTLLMMAGHAGTGKTTFSRLFMAHQMQAGKAWAFLDKDTIGGLFASTLMQLHTGDGMDRDSAVFSEKVRPLEYQALANVLRDNLSMGTSCIACAPFGRECATQEAFDAYATSFEDVANVMLVWSHISTEQAHARIVRRNHPMDKYKLDNWEAYAKRRYEPLWVQGHAKAFWFKGSLDEQTTALWWLHENT